MTIKRRFFISYISAIGITLGSLLLILGLAFYVTLGEVPSVTRVYKMMTNQRSLTQSEEESYLALNRLVKKSPEKLNYPFSPELSEIIQDIEAHDLNVVIRKNKAFPYYSADLVEKSLVAHIPAYELNNFTPTGTLDNAGRLYHYVKSDFQYLDGTNGSFIILKRESNLFEFFTRWGIWVVLLIIIVSILAAWLINYRLTKTTIEPLEELDLATKNFNHSRPSAPLLLTNNKKAVTKEVQQLQLSFETMWQKLYTAELNREKYIANRNELITNISHDLKTPITSIIGYVEGLLDGVANTPEKERHYLETIHKKGLNLNELIEQLFLYSKLETAEIVFKLERLNFNVYLTQLLEEYHWQENVRIKTTIPEQDLWVMIDPIQMTRGITNLIQNSLKFRDPQKETLILDFRLTSQSGILCLRLEDNGIGIAESELKNVFRRFYRVDKSRTPTVKGSGLGLSIVAQIINYHHGTIEMSSEKNHGTQVTIRLPLEEEENQ